MSTQTSKTKSTKKDKKENTTQKKDKKDKDSKAEPTKRSYKVKKEKEKKRPTYQHAVYKSKVKCKKLFQLLDANKRKRLNKAEFTQGLKLIFDQENIPVSELAINMLWDQVPKDVTEKYCGVNEFLSRFMVDKSSNFKIAEKPKTEDDLKAEAAPKKLAQSDIKKVQEALFLVFKGWRYGSASLLKSSKAATVYTRKEMRRVIVNMFAAERKESAALCRDAESWCIYYSVNDADLEKVLDFAEWNRKEQCKFGDLLDGLTRKLPAAKKVKPDEPVSAQGGLEVEVAGPASTLEEHTLLTVPADALRDWVADVLFHKQLSVAPVTTLRVGQDRVTDAPVLAFPPLAHWDTDFALAHAITAPDDPRTEKGGLLFFAHTVAVPGVKVYAGKTNGISVVVYAQHLYCCQSAVDGAILQWRMRAKLYLDAQERPVHIAVEDNQVWANGVVFPAPTTHTFSDWDFADLPFQTFQTKE